MLQCGRRPSVRPSGRPAVFLQGGLFSRRNTVRCNEENSGKFFPVLQRLFRFLVIDEISDEFRFHWIHSSRSCLELDPSCTLPNSPFTKTSNATAAEGASTPSLNTLLKFQSWSHRSTIAHSDRDAYSAYCVALGSLYYRCGGTLSMLLSESM